MTRSARAAALRQAFAVACVAALCLATGCASRAARTGAALGGRQLGSGGQADELSADQRALALQSFDLVWDTIRTSHWDPNLGGLNWPAVRDSLRPRVEKADTWPQARAAMNAMIATLGLSHYAILPRTAASALGGPSGEGVTGIDVRVPQNRALVVSVDPGSPAESAGIRPGWEMIEASGTDVRAILQPLRAEFAGRSLLELMLARAVLSHLRGPVGGKTAALLLDDAGREVRLELPLVVPRGTRATFGNLPPFYTWLEARRVEAGVGYVRITAFFNPGEMMPAFGRAVESFRDAPGMVLDLRGNPGGIGAMAMGMAGWLVSEPGHVLGTMTTRTGQVKFAISPRAETFTGPVAVLVDGLSASTAEILAAGLRDIGRARLFGTRTAGAALPSSVRELPDGDLFQYAVANYVSENGTELEGRGVVPDVVAPPMREALLRGEDPALDAAVKWIREGDGNAAGRQPDRAQEVRK